MKRALLVAEIVEVRAEVDHSRHSWFGSGGARRSARALAEGLDAGAELGLLLEDGHVRGHRVEVAPGTERAMGWRGQARAVGDFARLRPEAANLKAEHPKDRSHRKAAVGTMQGALRWEID